MAGEERQYNEDNLPAADEPRHDVVPRRKQRPTMNLVDRDR